MSSLSMLLYRLQALGASYEILKTVSDYFQNFVMVSTQISVSFDEIAHIKSHGDDDWNAYQEHLERKAIMQIAEEIRKNRAFKKEIAPVSNGFYEATILRVIVFDYNKSESF